MLTIFKEYYFEGVPDPWPTLDIHLSQPIPEETTGLMAIVADTLPGKKARPRSPRDSMSLPYLLFSAHLLPFLFSPLGSATFANCFNLAATAPFSAYQLSICFELPPHGQTSWSLNLQLQFPPPSQKKRRLIGSPEFCKLIPEVIHDFTSLEAQSLTQV